MTDLTPADERLTAAELHAVLLQLGFSHADLGLAPPRPIMRPVPVRGGLTSGRQSRALRDVEHDLATCRAVLWPPLRVVERVA